MNVAKLEKKSQIFIPEAILDRLGVEGEQLMLVYTTDDGAIMLHPASIYPVEIYSNERVREFLDTDTLPIEMSERAGRALTDRR